MTDPQRGGVSHRGDVLFLLEESTGRLGTTIPHPPYAGRGRPGIFLFPGQKNMALPSALEGKEKGGKCL